MALKFDCVSCDQTLDFSELKLIVANSESKTLFRYCKDCRSGNVTVHDVYFDGKPEINLADDPITGKPREFVSKGHKAAYLKQRGLREAGDKFHGAPISGMEHRPKTDSKHEVRVALKKVREMGRDVRRQEYLRIIKEGQERSHARYQ